MDEQTLILVDQNNNFLGYALRKECHTGKGRKHRAFVTLLFDSNNNVILQRRKHELFDNTWDLTAISHPLHIDGRDEDFQMASNRALAKEMGISNVPIKKIGGFNYFAKDGEGDCENEYCAVLIGKYDGPINPNSNEGYETKKINYQQFLSEV